MRLNYDRLRYALRMLLSEPHPHSAHADLAHSVDASVIDLFNVNPDNTYLISFPRTGSRWLRTLIELYFERPTLIETMIWVHSADYMLLHSYDLNLTVQRRNVIYLYRDPVETIYWQMHSGHEHMANESRVIAWATLYGQHLHKWLVSEDFTLRKTTIRYEELQQDLRRAFSKVTAHFGIRLKPDRIASVAARFAGLRTATNTEEALARADTSARALHGLYADTDAAEAQWEPEAFHRRYSDLIWWHVLDDRAALQPYLQQH